MSDTTVKKMHGALRGRLLPFVLATAMAWGCSSDPDSPLGTEFRDDGLIGSEPGIVFEDTVRVNAGDTAVVTRGVIGGVELQIGRTAGFETGMLVRFDFSALKEDPRAVSRAEMTLPFIPGVQTDVITARFYELLDAFVETDPLTELARSTDAIPDEGLVEVDREMTTLGTSEYTLPSALVQGWMDAGDHDGIAILVADSADSTQLRYGAREFCIGVSNCSTRPRLKLTFSDNTDTTLVVFQDGTFVKDLQSSSQLVLSDGVTRRIFLPLDLSGFESENVIHNATVRLFLVGPDPGDGPRQLSGDLSVSLYVPASDDPADSTFQDSRLNVFGVSLPATFEEDTAVLIPIGGAVQRALELGENTGLVLRYQTEGTSLRRAEFYGSGAPEDVRPTFFFTFSTPPEFAP